MILFPAIDLKDGACVRLLRGRMEVATVFNSDPAAQARQFAEAGFEWLHVVDLNGAFAGRTVNGEAIEAILGAVEIPVQLGGGIRDLDGIAHWLGLGVRRVILGTAALRDPELVRRACREFPDRIVVGIDAREGFVSVEGWAETTQIRTVQLARRFEDAGVAAIVFTDINRDGAMGGLNVEATVDLAFAVRIPVIASGGVSSLTDLRSLYDAAGQGEQAAGIEGVICGRALYDGRLDPPRALAVLRGQAG